MTLISSFVCVLGQNYRLRQGHKIKCSLRLINKIILTDICTVTNFHLKAKWSLHIASGIVQIRTSLNINELLFVANCYANYQSARIYHFIWLRIKGKNASKKSSKYLYKLIQERKCYIISECSELKCHFSLFFF